MSVIVRAPSYYLSRNTRYYFSKPARLSNATNPVVGIPFRLLFGINFRKEKRPQMRPFLCGNAKAYFFAVRRMRFSNRRASSPNNSVCVGCGKMALATCVSVISPATIITPMPIRVSV